jgi:hypothetical protein
MHVGFGLLMAQFGCKILEEMFVMWFGVTGTSNSMRRWLQTGFVFCGGST